MHSVIANKRPATTLGDSSGVGVRSGCSEGFINELSLIVFFWKATQLLTSCQDILKLDIAM